MSWATPNEIHYLNNLGHHSKSTVKTSAELLKSYIENADQRSWDGMDKSTILKHAKTLYQIKKDFR